MKICFRIKNPDNTKAGSESLRNQRPVYNVFTIKKHIREDGALKDLRAACFEPVNQLSGCAWKEGASYYQTTKDASTQFFFSLLPKGTYVFEYELWVNNTGTFSSGITSVQCLYAPEFVSHTGGEKITVK